jgi:Ca2+-binding EF-hand superfamily protein
LFDTDGSGLISCQELHKAIKSLGIEVEIDMVEDMINGVDGDATGDISFVEFIKLWNENFD